MTGAWLIQACAAARVMHFWQVLSLQLCDAPQVPAS